MGERLPAWSTYLDRPPFFNELAPALERAASASARLVRRYSKSHLDFIFCLLARESLEDNDLAELERFAVETLHLPRQMLRCVAYVLLDELWRAEPEPLRFVRREAVKIIAAEKRAGFSPRFHFISFESLEEEEKEPPDVRAESNLRLYDGFKDAIRICGRAGLTGERAKDAALLLLARHQGVTRKEASTLLDCGPPPIKWTVNVDRQLGSS